MREYRKVWKKGNSYSTTLIKEWIDLNKFDKGDYIEQTIDKKGNLILKKVNPRG